MTVPLAIALTVVATAVAVAALLLLRRRAPEGGFFADGDRAAGFFGVLATSIAILIGFVVFLRSRASTPRAAVPRARRARWPSNIRPPSSFPRASAATSPGSSSATRAT